MKKGKYRFIIQRTQEVLLTITDEDQFKKDFTAWANLLGPERTGEVTEIDYLRSRAHKLNDRLCPSALDKEVTNERLYIEDVRTCRHCGCTDGNACHLAKRNCDWHDTLDCCTNPDCIAKEVADLEKEAQHG